MAELEVDQSNLPRVQEVCQCFAVREDGALAHNLQEQEIEQYYSSNVQRNQLVQNDIRLAKRLQDEEQQRASMLHHQSVQQLEEQDSEYARSVQEEIQRCAEEAQRREEEDEEIAKRIQEEEELLVRQQTGCQRTESRENTSILPPPYTPLPAQPHLSDEEEQYDLGSHNRTYAPCSSTSDYEEDHCERRRHFSEDYRHHIEQTHKPTCDAQRRSSMGQECRSSVSESTHLGQGCRNSVSQSSCSGQDSRSSVSQSSKNSNFQGGWGDVVRLIKNDLSEQGYLSCSSGDELFEPVYRLERMLSQRQKPAHKYGERDQRLYRHSSVREVSTRTWHGEHLGRTRSFRDSGRSESRQVRRNSSNCSDSRPGTSQRHVHFQEDVRCHNNHSGSRRAFAGTREREVSSPPGRGHSFVYPSTANGGQHQAHRKGFQQSTQVRNLNQGDVHIGRRASIHETNRNYSHDEFQQGNAVRHFDDSSFRELRAIEEDEEAERGNYRVQREYRQRARSLREEGRREARESRRRYGNRRERQVCQGNEEESSSTEEEEVERERRRQQRRAWRLPQRCLSLPNRERSSRAESGLRRAGASLDLGELEQVLLDEDLARRLQAEEEKLLSGGTDAASYQRPYPEGDFRAAQVAQDEEIARFMQKQEIKAKRHSLELEGCGRMQEYREMNDMYDERGILDSQHVPRERLDSEGLMSPNEECFPEYQCPSSIAMTRNQHQVRNIAEELDPTFQRKETVHAEQNIAAPCQIKAPPQSGSCDLMEEPTFVPPTRRQSDKPEQVKTKERKENVKPKENCKQQ